jgi:lipopolysaccharide export system protein LptA
VRWQKAARYGVALSGVGVAVWLYASTRTRPSLERPTTGTVADPQATVQAAAGSQTRTRDDDKQFTFSWKSLRQLTDGRTILDGFKMTFEDGTGVSADNAETRGNLAAEDLPAELLLKGKVHMQTPEAASVDAAEAVYMHSIGRLTMPGAVSFVRGRTSGTGTGGSYERETGVFILMADARVTGAPTEGEGAFTASSTSLTFNRASNSLLFDGNAKIDTATSTMTAPRATLYLTDDKEHFRVIELRGGAHVAPIGDPAAPNAVPDMQSVDMDLSFHEGTQSLERAVLTRNAVMVVMEPSGRQSISATTIVAVTGPDGRTLTELDARERVDVRTPSRDGGPERQITAASLFGRGEPKRGLTSAQFAGGVTFIETTPAARGQAASQKRATSQTLSMVLGGKLDQIEEARFQRDVVFRDGDVTGDSDLGTYRAAKGQLVLEPASPVRRPPHVTSGDIDVNAADRIEIDLTTRDVHALGDVKTVMRKNPSARQNRSAIFDGDEATNGFGREFWYAGKSGQAKYVGRADAAASLRQGDRQVAAQTIEVDKDGGNLKANGSVNSTLLLEERGAGRGAAPLKYHITSETLDYRDDLRAATYTGLPNAPVVLTATDGVTSGHKIVLTLARESRTVQRLEATTDVSISLKSGRDGLGDLLTYDAATERYVLKGNVTLRIEEENKKSCSHAYTREAQFTKSSREPVFPTTPSGTRREQKNGPCVGPLTR